MLHLLLDNFLYIEYFQERTFFMEIVFLFEVLSNDILLYIINYAQI
jgi:hypothetical protein